MKKLLIVGLVLNSLTALATVENNCPELTGTYNSCEVVSYEEGMPQGWPDVGGTTYTISQQTAHENSEGVLDMQIYKIAETSTHHSDELNPLETLVVGETRVVPMSFGSTENVNLTEVSCADKKSLKVVAEAKMMDPEINLEMELKMISSYTKDGDDLLVNTIETMSSEGESLTNDLLVRCTKE